MPSMSVYIGGLGEDTQKEDLEREFGRFGNMTKVWVARNPPGFAFIDFENDDDADEAIKEMNGATINGYEIRVDASRGGIKRGGQGRGRGDGGFRGGRGGRGGGGYRGGSDSGFRRGGGGGRGFSRGGPRYGGGDGGYDSGSGYRRGGGGGYDSGSGYRGGGSGGYDSGSGYRSRSPIGQRNDRW